jgi:sporulation protein YlmC with PRC-barrel domain
MKKTLSTMAAAAVLMASTAVAPALAQTNTVNPATPAAPNAQTDTMTPPAGGAAGSTTAASGTTGMTGAYLTEQSETQISANDYIGKSIYNGENNSIGNVTDLIIEDNGGIVAAVVGVGGFLGIGQKNVAVPMDKIDVTREDNNDLRLTTTETADSLNAAPEFMTLDDQDSTTDAATTSSTGGATTTAPAGSATTPSTPARP